MCMRIAEQATQTPGDGLPAPRLKFTARIAGLDDEAVRGGGGRCHGPH